MSAAVRNTLALVGLVGSMAWVSSGTPERHLPPTPAIEASNNPGVLVVDLQDGVSEADLVVVERVLRADLDWVSDLSIDEGLAHGLVPDLAEAIRALEGHPLVEVVEPELQMEAYGAPNDPMYPHQWNLKQMGAPDAWAMGAMGAGVIVAVIDTGVSRVEDLAGTKMLKGATFVPGTTTADDDQGHGTHVAGTIAQTTNNGIGVAGVAPQATILPVKVLSKQGFGNSSWIASGVDYAVDNGAQVINLSLGGGYSAVIHNAIKKAEKKGVIVVAAAGNSGRKGVGYPGALQETIGVSATGPGGHLAPYSSWGKGVDISAPGGDKTKTRGGVLQNTIDGRGGDHYVEYQGTSMATPHVAGAAAVLLSRGLTPEKTVATLLESARGEGAWDEKFGHGQLDLTAALGAAPGSASSGGLLFALGGIFAFLLAQMAGTSTAFRMRSAAVGAVTAGGFFFLHALALPSWTIIELLGTGLLRWPEVLLGAGASNFPLWLSAALPMGLAFTLGAYGKTRPLALGVCAGVGATLIHGAIFGTLSPWWLPSLLGSAWLASNALVCMVLGMGMAGTEILETMERRR